MSNVIDFEAYKAQQFAKEFIREHGIEEFEELQELIKDFLRFAEENGFVPDEISKKYEGVLK